MSIIMKSAVLALAAASAWCFAGEDPEAKEEKPAVELGGYVTVDYGTDLTSDADPSFGIGEVDLSANVNISPEVVASITLMTYNRLDSLWIDQAMVAWTPSLLPVEFLFGQQTMNHGLLTTRLISDPLLLDDVELVQPSVILNGAMDMFTAGFGFTILSELDELNFDTTYRYSGVVNIDANLPNESLIRLSSLANGAIMDVDLAGTINFWKCAFDFEAMATKAEQDSVRASGVYAGLLYDITDRFSVALRGDGVSFSDENFKDIDMRVAGGVTIKIKDGIFCAAEVARRLPSAGGGVNEIAVEVGLEQTIQLPGFQRKTLTRE
jgi:hypothetical protein